MSDKKHDHHLSHLNTEEKTLVEEYFSRILGASFEKYEEFIRRINRDMDVGWLNDSLKDNIGQDSANALVKQYFSATTIEEKQTAFDLLIDAYQNKRDWFLSTLNTKGMDADGFITVLTDKHNRLVQSTQKKEDIKSFLIQKIDDYVANHQGNQAKQNVMKSLRTYLLNPTKENRDAVETAKRENRDWNAGIFSTTTASTYRKVMQMYRAGAEEDESPQLIDDPSPTPQKR